MLGDLRRTAAQIEGGLREFLGFLGDQMQGLHLLFDPVWLESVRFNLMRWSGVFSFPRYDAAGNNLFAYALKFDDWRLPMDYRPNNWQKHCWMSGFPKDAQPILIRVVLRRDPRHEKFGKDGDLPNSFDNYPIIYEYRPPCIGYSSYSLAVGSSIGGDNTNESGTLGGFLRSRSQRPYFITCAHVVSGEENRVFSPAPADSASAQQVGIVRYSNVPKPTPAGSNCNSRSMSTENVVDVTCAEMDPRIIPESHRLIGVVNDIDPVEAMPQGGPLVFAGKTTKFRRAEIGAMCIWHEIKIAGQPHCFSDVFEITHQKPYYLNTSLAKPGDSGAWTISQKNNCVSWNGMLIGGDGAHAYCCFAENVMKSLRSAGHDLVLSLDSTATTA